jgi:hypothetical protein
MPSQHQTRHGIDPEFLDAAEYDKMLRDNVDEIEPVYRSASRSGTVQS